MSKDEEYGGWIGQPQQIPGMGGGVPPIGKSDLGKRIDALVANARGEDIEPEPASAMVVITDSQVALTDATPLGVLQYLNELDIALMATYDIAEAIKIKDKDEAIQWLTQKADLDKGIQNEAAASLLRAQRKIAILNRQRNKNKGTRLGGNHVLPPGNEATYEELGTSKQEIYRIDALADLPEQEFEDFVQNIKESGYQLTSAAGIKYAKNYKHAHTPTVTAAVMPASVQVIHGGMLDTIGDWDGPRFDLVVADPPYNVTEWHWDRIGPEFLAVTRTWLEAVISVCKSEYNLFWFCSPQYMADIELVMRELDLPIQSRIIWNRRNMAKGSDAKMKFIDSYEMIFHVGNRPLNFPPQWTDARFDVQTFAVPQTNFSDTKLHPTQKPLDLIRRLVAFGSYPGDAVLDPFAGSGTTGEACILETNRTCVLIEREAEYIEVINGRLSK